MHNHAYLCVNCGKFRYGHGLPRAFGEQGNLFQGTKKQMSKTREQRYFWGTGNIGNQDFEKQGNKGTKQIISGQQENSPPPTHSPPCPGRASVILGNKRGTILPVVQKKQTFTFLVLASYNLTFQYKNSKENHTKYYLL